MDESALFHNCLRVDRCAAGLVPRRFTEAQLAHWDRSGVVRMTRARSCAGITMRFYTSQQELRFSYQVLSNCKDEIAFDLYEGGQLTDSVTRMASEGNGKIVFHRLFSGETGRTKEVMIYLPYTAEVALSCFNFGEDVRTVPERMEVPRIQWLGDSISQGMRAEHPSQTLVSVLGRRLNCEILNHGVGGCGFRDISRDFSAGDWKPDFLVILLGTNDTAAASENGDGYAACLKARLDDACSAFSPERIRMITPFWRADLTEPRIGVPFEKICEQIRQEAENRGIPLIEGFEANPRCIDCFEDGRLHPNESGFSAIAEVLEKQLLWR